MHMTASVLSGLLATTFLATSAMAQEAVPDARAAMPVAAPAPAQPAATQPAPTTTAAPTTAPAAPMAPPAVVEPVPVRLGQHDSYTRVVFDLPRLTAYNATASDGALSMTFDMQAPVAAVRGNAVVKSIRNTGPGQVTITAAPGATFKHYRLMKKIVVDVTPKKAPAPPKAEALKKDVAAAPELQKIDPSKSPLPAPQATSETAPAPAAAIATPAKAPAPAATAPAVPAAPVTPVTQDAIDAEAPALPGAEPTFITVSTLEPVRIAAFTRFNTLWVVLDSASAGVKPPDVTGPGAVTLGDAQVLKFEGGTAYRYNFPRGAYLGVNRKGSDWKISVSPQPLRSPVASQMNVQFDDVSHQAKLIVPLKGGGKLMTLEDPAAGDKIFVIATDSAEARVDQTRRFADVEILPAAVGMAVQPLSDSVRVNRIENFALITSPEGIVATPTVAAGPALIMTDDTSAAEDRLFDFPNWRQGGITHLNENRENLQRQIAETTTPAARSELLRKLALLYFANNFGHETLAVLRLLEQDDPESAQNPNFVALRGVAHAMAGHYPEAFRDLSTPAIQQHGEVRLWMGYVSAATEQWTKANEYFPRDNRLLAQYPDNLSVPMTVYMAESALRLGRTDTAKKLLGTLDNLTDTSSLHYRAAIGYLKGEIARQEGKPEEAMRSWRPIADGMDRLFHTKASLALANLELQQKVITPTEAIEHIDSLRFAWRGDGLEVSILHNLGLLKVQNGKYLEGLEDIKKAAELAESMNDDATPQREDLTRLFAQIFSGETPVKISPLEAVSVYNTFGNLIPRTEQGADISLKVADALLSMDLLGKAVAVIESQLSANLVAPAKIPATGAKLAAIYLLDAQPAQALAAIDKTAAPALPAALTEERALLRARALSQTNQTDAAINVLTGIDSTDARRLKADVLWRARRWSEAAVAIESALPPLQEGKPMTPEDAGLVINAAVAYKLAGDASGLQTLRQEYSAAMAATPMAATFGVVTRAGGAASLSDRETILNIAGEVDMFKGFLDSYKAGGKGT